MIKLHPENAKSLDAIEKSLYALALDDVLTPDIEQVNIIFSTWICIFQSKTQLKNSNSKAVKYGLYKNPKNRFFDKAYTHVITKSGLATSNTEVILLLKNDLFLFYKI